MCHVSRVTCRMSHVIFYFLFYFFDHPPPKKNIRRMIRIGREIQCLPYAGFFHGSSLSPASPRNPMCRVFPTVTSCNLPNVGAGGGEQVRRHHLHSCHHNRHSCHCPKVASLTNNVTITNAIKTILLFRSTTVCVSSHRTSLTRRSS